MADLDDFFAKKDRKKSKNVKKFATADELAKKLEDTTKKVDKPVKKERPVTQGQEGDEQGNVTHVCMEFLLYIFAKFQIYNGHIVHLFKSDLIFYI